MGKASFIFLFLLSLIFLFWQKVQYSSLSNQQKFNYLVKQDLKMLKEQNFLPKAWAEIGSVEVYGEQKDDLDWLEHITLPIKLKPNGNRHLEAQVLSWNIDGQNGAVINYHLFDKKSKNMVWEFGRTFKLSKETIERKK